MYNQCDNRKNNTLFHIRHFKIHTIRKHILILLQIYRVSVEYIVSGLQIFLPEATFFMALSARYAILKNSELDVYHKQKNYLCRR